MKETHAMERGAEEAMRFPSARFEIVILQMMAILTLHWCGFEIIAIWILVWALSELRFYQECVGCQRPTIRAIASDAKVI